MAGERKRNWNGKQLRLYSGIMLLCFLALLSVIYYIQYYQLSKELKAVNEEIGKMEEVNIELEKEVKRLQEDEYIEFLARRHLGLSRSDEGLMFSDE